MTLRLAHRLLKGHRPGRDPAVDRCVAALTHIPIIIADEVREFVDSQIRQTGKFAVEALPRITPPFEDCWVEVDLPGEAQVGGTVSLIERSVTNVSGSVSRWLVAIRCFVARKDNNYTPDALDPWFGLALAADGTQISHAAKWPDVSTYRDGYKAHTEKGLVAFASVACATFAFMHCKNVVLADADDLAPKDKWLRRFRLPKLTYKTLRIAPMAAIVRKHANDTGQPLDKAMHICRGHFRNYDESSKGLFGKYHGTFWVPHHVRGNMASGSVVKQYEVSTKGV